MVTSGMPTQFEKFGSSTTDPHCTNGPTFPTVFIQKIMLKMYLYEEGPATQLVFFSYRSLRLIVLLSTGPPDLLQ